MDNMNTYVGHSMTHRSSRSRTGTLTPGANGGANTHSASKCHAKANNRYANI
jgi:hypothetical protein